MLFFFYGTLMDGSDNPVARALHRLIRPLGPATAAGSLHAIPDEKGWFPALLPGSGPVHGALYAARDHFGPDDLARIDAYEDFWPDNPERSLYIRATIPVQHGEDRVSAEAYLFHQPLPAGSLAIVGGSFRDWLREKGAAAFSGLRDAT